MPVVILLIAAAAILGGVVVVAMGRGGELARSRPPRPTSDDLRTWADVAGYRPPAALLGYHAATTERAFMLVARTLAEREAEIDWLRARLAELQPERASQAMPGGHEADWDEDADHADGAEPTASARGPDVEPDAPAAPAAAEPADDDAGLGPAAGSAIQAGAARQVTPRASRGDDA